MSTFTITHASKERITNVKTYDSYSSVVKGCLFFGGENNDYNLAGECNYQYNLNVENILVMSKLNYDFDCSENEIIQSVFESFRSELDLDLDDEEISEIFDETNMIADYENSNEDECEWILQQYQGILAHKLGFDCAQAVDEQGTVYIAYCVDRELTEIVL